MKQQMVKRWLCQFLLFALGFVLLGLASAAAQGTLSVPAALGLAVLLASAQPAGLGRRRALGLGGFGAVYAAGAMAAMYITYTPVAMVRIVGLQARYFLPVFLALALVAVAPLRRLLAPQLPLPRAERLAVPLFAGHALLGAVLLFQHYFVGPFYTIPA